MIPQSSVRKERADALSKQQSPTASPSRWRVTQGTKAMDEVRAGGARWNLMVSEPRGVASSMRLDAMPPARPNCAPFGVRPRIRLVVWIEAPQLQVAPPTLSGPCGLHRFFLDLSSCR